MYFTFTYVGPQVPTSREAPGFFASGQKLYRPPRMRFTTSIAISFLKA